MSSTTTNTPELATSQSDLARRLRARGRRISQQAVSKRIEAGDLHPSPPWDVDAVLDIIGWGESPTPPVVPVRVPGPLTINPADLTPGGTLATVGEKIPGGVGSLTGEELADLAGALTWSVAETLRETAERNGEPLKLMAPPSYFRDLAGYAGGEIIAYRMAFVVDRWCEDNGKSGPKKKPVAKKNRVE